MFSVKFSVFSGDWVEEAARRIAALATTSSKLRIPCPVTPGSRGRQPGVLFHNLVEVAGMGQMGRKRLSALVICERLSCGDLRRIFLSVISG